jgi:hypothetical protein
MTARESEIDRPTVSEEAFTLPLLFLTVALTGGFRAGAGGQEIQMLPPSLVSLVLAMLLLGALVQCGVLMPHRLMSTRRDGLANISGAVVLASLFAATAQVLSALTPEAGLLHAAVNLVFFLLLWNTMAASPDPRHMLRSLLVVLGSAFTFKYILLEALYDPDGGLAKRMLTVLLEGASLGTLAYEPHAPATGYVAFFSVTLYMIGLILLPRSRRLVARRGRPSVHPVRRAEIESTEVR